MWERERLLGQVRARLGRFRAGRGPEAAPDPTAVAGAAALLAAAPDLAANLEVICAAGWRHWERYLALGPERGRQDRATALALFAPVYRVRPGAVPDQVRAHFDGDGLGSPDTPEAWANQATTFLKEAFRTGDRVSLDTAVDLFGRAVDAAPADNPNRAAMLADLSVALHTRFERAGQPADLDAAITACRAAVDAAAGGHRRHAVYLSSLAATRSRTLRVS